MAKPVSVFSAAKRLGEHSGWTLTHLQMQKMLYICHMYYMGESGEPLIDGYFEAWHYGPVNVDLYHHLKACGAESVPPSMLSFSPIISEDHPGRDYLDAGVEQLNRERLVAITHWGHGAWAKRYKKGVRGIGISNEDIMEEFRKRMEWPDEE